MNAVKKFLPGTLSILGFGLLWQIATSFGPLKGGSLPTATTALASVFGLLGMSSVWVSVYQTLYIALIGLAISVAMAIPVGVVVGLSQFAFKSTKLVLDFFKVIPPIVIIPIVVLTFGPTSAMGIFLVVFANFFMLVSQTAYGVRDTDLVLIDTLKCYGIGRMGQIWHARIPGALPFIAVGIRIAVSASMIVAVVSGLIGGAPSLGHQMLLFQSSNQPAKTFGVVIILGILGLSISRLYALAQRKIVFWTNA